MAVGISPALVRGDSRPEDQTPEHNAHSQWLRRFQEFNFLFELAINRQLSERR